MLMKTTLIALLFSILFGCNSVDTNSNVLLPNKNTKVETQPSFPTKNHFCKCLKENENKASTYSTKSLDFVVCGTIIQSDLPGLIMSNLSIYNCDTQESITQFDSATTYRIKTQSDTIKIEIIEKLPFGEHWSWQPIKTSSQNIYIKDDSINVTQIMADYTSPKIDPNLSNSYIEFILKYGAQDLEWDHTIGVLKLLALNNDKRASNILSSFDKYYYYKNCNLCKEHLTETLKEVKWLTK